MTLGAPDAQRLQQCLAEGGVAVFPSDTVYGVGCDPHNQTAVERLYALKGKPAEHPAAVMFFDLEKAIDALPELKGREHAVLGALLPGPVTVLLPNRGSHFLLACGPSPQTLGLRVPLLTDSLKALEHLDRPVMQSSANISGQSEARRLADVAQRLLDGVDLTLDAGQLPGVPSTVLDLSDYEDSGQWRILREGALPRSAVEHVVASC